LKHARKLPNIRAIENLRKAAQKVTQNRTTNHNSRPSVRKNNQTHVQNTTDVRSVSNVAYGSGTRPQTRSNSGLNWNAIGLGGAIILVALIMIYAIFPWPINITLNGQDFSTTKNITLAKIVERAALDIQSGNFVAVDGSVLEEGAGYAFAAVVNGESETNENRKLKRGDVVEITNGQDIMEDYTEEIQEEAQGVSFDGVGAVHKVESYGSTGQISVKTGLVSGITTQDEVQSPQDAIVKFFNVDTGDNKVIALTFDDGPWDTYTNEILDILAEYNAKATFFTVGERIEKNADAVAREYAEGHQVCTHTWDHANGDGQGVNLGYMTEEERVSEVTQGYQAIADACSIDVSDVNQAIRAPGGNFSTEVAKSVLNYITAEVGWNIDTEDWRRPGASTIAQRILKATNGNIVLMHDGGGDRSQTVEALRTALPQMVEQGYKFVTIDELLTYAQ
jgi:peptidoglycan/xylan/chitin deacetylase (PgdA/CDA1 family)